jgi:hypothetical protein
LQTPFFYDSSKTLIVEIKFYNSTGTAFGTMGNNNNDQKIISSYTASLVAIGSSATWQDFGFDYLITTGTANLNTSNGVMVYPNPTNGLITINNLNFKNEGTISVFDVYGKLVFHRNYNTAKNSENIDIDELESDIYFLKVATPSVAVIKKIIKN